MNRDDLDARSLRSIDLEDSSVTAVSRVRERLAQTTEYERWFLPLPLPSLSILALGPSAISAGRLTRYLTHRFLLSRGREAELPRVQDVHRNISYFRQEPEKRNREEELRIEKGEQTLPPSLPLPPPSLSFSLFNFVR